METMHELFEHELKDMYYAEKRLVAATEKMSKHVSTKELSALFKEHHKQTKNQVKRLEKVFKLMRKKPVGMVCHGMNGLIEEHNHFMKEKPSKEISDYFHIGSALKAEAYEINSYEHLIQTAREIGLHDSADLLTLNMEEEKNMFNMLKAMRADYSTSAVLDELADFTATKASA